MGKKALRKYRKQIQAKIAGGADFVHPIRIVELIDAILEDDE